MSTPAPTGLAIVHLMKTGGTSVGSVVQTQFAAAQVYPVPGRTPLSNPQKVYPRQLMNMPEAERMALRFVSVHMPAWVLAATVPHLPSATILRHPVDRTISHLRQLARTAFEGVEIDELWEHPKLHRRMVNYQTQIFADTEESFRNRQNPTVVADEMSAAARAELRDELRAIVSTGLTRAIELDESSMDSAVDQLEAIDVVGTTDDLTRFGNRITARTNVLIPEIGHVNRATDDAQASSALRMRIEADSQLDLALYEHAKTLA